MVEHWILPTNAKYFDLPEHFKLSDKVYWKKTKKINQNDLVFIYLATPFKEIRYKCVVTNENVSSSFIEEKAPYAINRGATPIMGYVELTKLDEYTDGRYSMEELRNAGMGQFQVLSRAGRNVKELFQKNGDC